MQRRFWLLLVASLLAGSAALLLVGGMHTRPMWIIHGQLVTPESLGNAGLGPEARPVTIHDRRAELWIGCVCAAAAIAFAATIFRTRAASPDTRM